MGPYNSRINPCQRELNVNISYFIYLNVKCQLLRLQSMVKLDET